VSSPRVAFGTNGGYGVVEAAELESYVQVFTREDRDHDAGFVDAFQTSAKRFKDVTQVGGSFLRAGPVGDYGDEVHERAF
jgi:hypothetical protein